MTYYIGQISLKLNIQQQQNSDHLTHPKYRPDIDGLRAIAILSVIGFHAFPLWIKGGFIGVDIFFVISGFLISTIMIGSLERNSFSFVEFYVRRINRIFPALLLVLIACFVFGWFALLADEYKQLGKHIAGGAGFISNFLLWNEIGYFDNATETKPLLHLWSLGVEEQFYIIWPLLLWLAWKRRLNLLTITIVVGIISFLLNVAKVRGDPVAAFYSPQTRFWELMAGSVLAYIMRHYQDILNAWFCKIVYAQSSEVNGKTLCDTQSFLGAIFLTIGLLVITKEKPFPSWWTMLPILGAMLIIFSGAQAWLNRKVLSNRVLVWFGLISFPLYLWHWPLLSFARIIEGETPEPLLRIAGVLISIVLAWLTYILIEKPVRFGKHGKSKAIILIVLMLAVAAVGYNCYTRDGLKLRTSISHAEKANAEFLPWKYIVNDTCLNKYPFNTEGYSWWICMASKNENPTLILLGDSYANHWYPGFLKNTNLNHHSILSIGTCRASWVEQDEWNTEPSHFPCAGHRMYDQHQFINDIIEKSGSVKFAIIHSYGKSFSSMKKRIDFLEKNNIKVIAFLPHIHPNYDIKECFDRPFRKPQKKCEIDREGYEKFVNENGSVPFVEELKRTNPNVAIFNPNELYCDAIKCSFILNGMPIFRDEYHHFSEYASIELGKHFEKWARTNVPDIFN